MITNEKLVGLGLVKLNNIVEPLAPLIKDLTECIYIFESVFNLNPMWIKENPKLVHPIIVF